MVNDKNRRKKGKNIQFNTKVATYKDMGWDSSDSNEIVFWSFKETTTQPKRKKSSPSLKKKKKKQELKTKYER